MAIIELNKVTKVYQSKSDIQVHALDGVSFKIDEGEFTAIVGPSGSGKSTILNILGCLDTPTSGHFFVDSQDMSIMDEYSQAIFRRNKIGFIFQAYNLIPVLTAEENIAFPLTLLSYSHTEIKKKVKESLQAVGLADKATRRPNELSGGQQQRIAIARALAKNPRIVLADEPTANLDLKTGKEVLDVMKHLNETMGVTFIISTHDKMVMDYANRLINLNDGQVSFDKIKEEVSV